MSKWRDIEELISSSSIRLMEEHFPSQTFTIPSASKGKRRATRDRVSQLYFNGKNIGQIVTATGLSRSTIVNYIKELE